MLEAALGLALLVLLVYAARRLALHRGRSATRWMWLTALFGPFSLALLALLPRRGDRVARAPSD